jgi:hypothetical protein
MARSVTAHLLATLEAQHPDELAEAREAVRIIQRHVYDFVYPDSNDDLTYDALGDVCELQCSQPTLTRTERVKAVAAALRRRMRRRRAVLPPPQPVEPTVLDALCARDLLQQLQRRWDDDDQFALFLALMDPDTNALEVTHQRHPGADAHTIKLEHARLRRLKRKLLQRAQADVRELLEGVAP